MVVAFPKNTVGNTYESATTRPPNWLTARSTTLCTKTKPLRNITLQVPCRRCRHVAESHSVNQLALTRRHSWAEKSVKRWTPKTANTVWLSCY
jgi:hypothetical protein